MVTEQTLYQMLLYDMIKKSKLISVRSFKFHVKFEEMIHRVNPRFLCAG